jgi:hypothetical protein
MVVQFPLVHRFDERSQALSEMGAELIVADLTNDADVVRALRGCKRMYFDMSISPTSYSHRENEKRVGKISSCELFVIILTIWN